MSLLATAAAAPESWVTMSFAAILIAMVLMLALETTIHAKKSMITGMFAIGCLLFAGAVGLLPYDHYPTMPVYIAAIDWEVIAIIVGSSLFVDSTSESGLFSWIAIKLTKKSQGDPAKLLVFYGVMTVVFSAVLNNVTAMIIVGSLTAVSLRKLEREDLMLGFLLTEGLLTNIGGLLTLVSSVPNIIIGNAAGISFTRFFVVAAPFVVVATIVTIVQARATFKIRPLEREEDRRDAAERVAGFDENDGVKSEVYFFVSAAMLVGFIGCLAGASVIPVVQDLNMGFVALAFGFVALWRHKGRADEYYRAIDWDLILFFASLFIVIHIMEYAGVLGLLGAALQVVIDMGRVSGSAVLLVAAAGLSAVTDNIPLAAMLGTTLSNIPEIAADPDSPMWWAVVFGSNLGGNLTPIGSASTVVAVTVMGKVGLDIGFLEFVRRALPFAVIQIGLAVGYLLLYSQL